MDKLFKGINHGKEKINLTHLSKDSIELRPAEIHLKEDGSIECKPSFTIVMIDDGCYPINVYGQISLKMFNNGFNDIGYKIVKKE